MEQNRMTAVIYRLAPSGRLFGFATTPDDQQVFFSASDVTGPVRFRNMQPGDEVSFVPDFSNALGLQAVDVMVTRRASSQERTCGHVAVVKDRYAIVRADGDRRHGGLLVLPSECHHFDALACGARVHFRVVWEPGQKRRAVDVRLFDRPEPAADDTCSSDGNEEQAW